MADAAHRFAAFDEPYDIVYRTRTLKDKDYIILHSYGRSIYPEPGVRLISAVAAILAKHFSKCVAEVYDRADHNMYDNKISLKAGR